MELHTLWDSETAQVLLSDWDRARHPTDREGCTKSAVIEFMRAGSYARRLLRSDVLIDANHVAFFNPREPFRVSHPCGDRNRGLSLRVSSDLLASVLADTCRAAIVPDSQPFRRMSAITSPRCHLLQDRLVRILNHNRTADPAFVEELLLHLVCEAVTTAYDQRSILDCPRPSRIGRSGKNRIETVRAYMLVHWAERLTLGALAELVDCSSWHLACLFRAEVGLPIYRYLKRLRLRHALVRLEDGCSDLTHLALECGFSSHSHFTMSFRREFGTTPSSIRSADAKPKKIYGLLERRDG